MTEAIPERVEKGLKNFRARTWLPGKVLDWYRSGSSRLLLLTGMMGSGKSLAAAWLAGLGGGLPNGKAGEQLAELRKQVAGWHICQSSGGSLAPKALAVHINHQLSEKVGEFDEAFTLSLPELIRIDARLRIEENQPGAVAQVVKIDHLSLGEYGDQRSYLLLLHDPLLKLYERGFNQSLLLVVDGLDEAALYTERYTILDVMRQLDDLPHQVRFVATIRSNSAYLNDFPGAVRIDLENDSPDVRKEIWEFTKRRLAKLPKESRSVLVDKVADAANGKFLYAASICEDLLQRHKRSEDILALKLPKDQAEQYHRELRTRLAKTEAEWEKVSAVLGLVGVAQGWGLARLALEEVRGEDVLPALKNCRQYLDGKLNDGPFRLFHASLSEYLFEDEDNQDFHLDAWRQHKALADYYWNQTNGKPAWKNWDAYGVQYAPAHLRLASETPLVNEKQRQIRRLVELLGESEYQQCFLSAAPDYNRLGQLVGSALHTVTVQKGAAAALLVTKAALNLYRFRRARDLPAAIFSKAQAGELSSAMRMLAALEPEPKWAKAAALTAAWLAAGAGAKQSAQAVFAETASMWVNVWPLPLLAGRVEAAWTKVEPGWEPLPANPPTRELALDILRQLGGGEVEPGKISEYLNSTTGLVSVYTISSFEGMSPDAASGYMAQFDGPALVTYALFDEADGKNLFESYVRIHGANQYQHYRDLSLWLLVGSALRHPNPEWARWGVRQILEQALKPVDVSHDREDIDLAALARLVQQGDTNAVEEFDNRRRWGIQAAAELSEERGSSDQYGRNKQRLCALAEAASCLGGLPALRARMDDCEKLGDDGIDELIRRAQCMAGGFAGFLYRAWLRLADTVRICGREAVFSIEDIFERARQAAINIHDPVFAALAAAQVSACRELSAALPAGGSLEALVRRFVRDPFAPEFSPRLQIGDEYKGRQVKGAKIGIPWGIAEPHNLSILAGELGFPVDRLERLNQPQVADRQAPLAGVKWVFLPADNFAPLMAERLSAAVLSDKSMIPDQKQALIQLLAPVATAQGSSLDIVLGRLLLATEVSDAAGLETLRQELAGKK